MPFLVEQIKEKQEIILDYDEIIHHTRIKKIVIEYFPNAKMTSDNFIIGDYNGEKYLIYPKQITYLGNPWELNKKRIQISNLQAFNAKAKEYGATPLLIGLYIYKNTIVFADFKIECYLKKKSHNSSAHVQTEDIVNALSDRDGIVQKIDYLNNEITLFRKDAINYFLDNKFGKKTKEYKFDYEEDTGEVKKIVYSAMVDDPEYIKEFLPGYKESKLDKLFDEYMAQLIELFFRKEKKHWDGIECYKDMIDNNYNNCYQCEWPGFYLEYEFEKFLYEYGLTEIIKYSQNKKEGEIDLDLIFPLIDCYGDLKAHASNSNAVQGNDFETIKSVLDSGKHIYYVICEHDTERDKDHENRVAKFRDSVKHKKNDNKDHISYAEKMKSSVDLKHMYVLDINRSNAKYLKLFKQGVNSNGKLREPKIMIDVNDFDKFLITDFAKD